MTNDIDSLNECIDEGRCKSTLFKLDGCPSCIEMKEKLDALGVEYDERDIDAGSLTRFRRKTVPFLYVEDEGEEIIIENESIERIRKKLTRR